jgi:hypothetical protein
MYLDRRANKGTKCGRRRLGGSCKLSPCHFTTVRSSCTHRISRQASARSTTNADPACSAWIANLSLWSAMKLSRSHLLAASTVSIPASLRQPVLQRMEHSLRAASRLGRVGRDMLDAKLAQCPTNLRQRCLRDLAANLVG